MKDKKQIIVLLILAVCFMIGGYVYSKSNSFMGGIIFGIGLGVFGSNAFRLIK